MAERLDADILWCIFLIIVETDFKARSQKVLPQAPLTVLHRSSQVCRRWRDVLIDSCGPLWGKAIHADLLGQTERRWRDEILKRANSSRLWVTGRIAPDDSISAAVFKTSMRNLWPRIQHFSVAVNDGRTFQVEAWKGLEHPAPCLESFSFESLPWARGFHIPTPCNLFSNHAPLLQQFSFSSGGSEFIAMKWFSGLRTLNISLNETNTVTALLLTAPYMTRLEELILALDLPSPQRPYELFRPQSVLIPSLSLIRISPDLPSASTFLDIVVPHADCLLHGVFYHRSISRTNFMLKKILSKYGANYLQSHIIEGLSIVISCGTFAIGELQTSDYIDKFYISGTDPEAKPSIPNKHLDIALLISVLPLEAFSNVTRLEFASGDDFCELDTPAFVKLLESLHNLEVLVILRRGLLFLSRISSTTPPPISRLHTLKIYRDLPEFGFPNSESVEELFVPLFESRQRAGVPIKIFDITHTSATLPFPENLPDLTLLEAFHDLKIWWGEETSHSEHICGSGNIKVIE